MGRDHDNTHCFHGTTSRARARNTPTSRFQETLPSFPSSARDFTLPCLPRDWLAGQDKGNRCSYPVLRTRAVARGARAKPPQRWRRIQPACTPTGSHPPKYAHCSWWRSRCEQKTTGERNDQLWSVSGLYCRGTIKRSVLCPEQRRASLQHVRYISARAEICA